MSPKSPLTVFAPAKINLHLAVGDRRADGYHNLESLFLALDFGDILHFEPCSVPNLLEIAMDWPNAGSELGKNPVPTEKNIIYKAVNLFRQETGFSLGLRIHVEKRIPIGGGLGGGSSNAAATLLALNKMVSDTVPALEKETLLQMAAILGSDVPFFLHETAAAWVTGRGERIEPIEVPQMFFVLVNPGFGSDTAAAFRLLDEYREGFYANCDKGLGTRDWGLGLLFDKHTCLQLDMIANKDQVSADPSPQSPVPSPRFFNDFLPIFPEPQKSIYYKIISELTEQGAVYANLSGSGSTCFGVFKDARQVKKAADVLRGKWAFVQECSSKS